MMDKGVKQRLLGGIVLIAGAALFLPLLFDGSGAGSPPRPEIPAKPAVPGNDDLAPQLDKQAAAASAAVDSAHTDPTFYPVAAPAASAENSVAAGTDGNGQVSSPATPAQPDASALAAAQAAAEAKAQKQQALKDKQAQEAKVQAEQDAREAKAEKERQAAAAKKLAEQKAAQKDDAGVAEAWVVQVASLGSQAKASDLVSKLHKKGYRATSHEAGGAWKVTVGPELNKDIADSIKDKLANDSDLHLSGWVQAYRP